MITDEVDGRDGEEEGLSRKRKWDGGGPTVQRLAEEACLEVWGASSDRKGVGRVRCRHSACEAKGRLGFVDGGCMYSLLTCEWWMLVVKGEEERAALEVLASASSPNRA
jgi:hypothetical protein